MESLSIWSVAGVVLIYQNSAVIMVLAQWCNHDLTVSNGVNLRHPLEGLKNLSINSAGCPHFRHYNVRIPVLYKIDSIMRTPVSLSRKMHQPLITGFCNSTGMHTAEPPQKWSGTNNMLICSHILSAIQSVFGTIPSCLAHSFCTGGSSTGLFIICKLTIASNRTLSGLVLYANVVWVNCTLFLPGESTDALSVYIGSYMLSRKKAMEAFYFCFPAPHALIHLIIETCFYNVLHAYSKTWLQFVLPV